MEAGHIGTTGAYLTGRIRETDADWAVRFGLDLGLTKAQVLAVRGGEARIVGSSATGLSLSCAPMILSPLPTPAQGAS